MRKISDYILQYFFHDRLFLVSLSAGIGINIIIWLIIFSKFQFSQETIPLHFNPVYGIDLLGKTWRTYELPGLGLAILLINAALGKKIYPAHKFFAYLLNFSAASIQVLLLAAALALIVINA